ncbi:MAG: protein kinase, partial [Planctomycetales bacterium]|nr:protein kinase [Planctomycetales bacterium]
DIKPANILIERDGGKAMLTDFGLAQTVCDVRLTQTGCAAGTPCFMSPEQAKAEPLDTRSDLFSLGAVLYTAATGRIPFEAESIYAVIRKVCEANPEPLTRVNPDVPEWFSQAVERLMMKDPANRFQSAEEFYALLVGHPQTGAPSQDSRKLGKSASGLIGLRPRTYLTIASCVLAVCLIVFGLSRLGFGPNRTSPQDVRVDAQLVAGPIRIVGSEQRFESLADAINEAADGAEIEIDVDGEVELSKCEIVGKRITIRGADSKRPVLTHAAHISPVITSDVGLTLENLTLHKNGGARGRHGLVIQDGSDCFISVASGDLIVRDCNFTATDRGFPVWFAGDSCQIDSCRFTENTGCAVLWSPKSESNLSLVNNFVASPIGCMVFADTKQEERGFKFTLIKNTFRSTVPIQMTRSNEGTDSQEDSIPDEASFCEVYAERNLFACTTVVNVRAFVAFGRDEARVKKLLKYMMRWNGNHNVFSGIECLASASRSVTRRRLAIHETLQEWSKEMQESNSAVAKIEFTQSPSSEIDEPRVVEWLEGPEVQGFGATIHSAQP